MTTIAELPAGFADKVLSAQSTFRSVMDAMARPGNIQRIAVATGGPSPINANTTLSLRAGLPGPESSQLRGKVVLIAGLRA